MRLFIFLSLLFFSVTAYAQVGIGTQTPNASAALEVKDTTRGVLIPRMTVSQRTAIVNPAEALMIYQTNGEKGFWYFDGGQWAKIGNQNNNIGAGKTILILEDTITDAQAQAKIQAEVGPNTQMIRIIGCTNLTHLDLSSLTISVGILIKDNPVLQDVNLGNLISCYDNFYIENCPQLSSINLNSLKGIFMFPETEHWKFQISETGISTLSLPNLKKCNGDFHIEENSALSSISMPLFTTITDDLYIYKNPLLSSLTFPGLVNAGGISISSNNLLTNVSFPLLSTSSIDISSNNLLTNVSFPLLSTTTGIFIYNNANLSSISIDNLTQFVTQSYYYKHFNTSGNKLPSSNINSLLRKLVTITPSLTGAQIDVSQQSPVAPPTGQGITDKNTLIANGNTVTTD